MLLLELFSYIELNIFYTSDAKNFSIYKYIEKRVNSNTTVTLKNVLQKGE